jgi:hypothetical protein
VLLVPGQPAGRGIMHGRPREHKERGTVDGAV